MNGDDYNSGIIVPYDFEAHHISNRPTENTVILNNIEYNITLS